MNTKDARKKLDEQEFKKQAADLLKNISENVDADVHYADDKKSGRSTLCGKPIPPAKEGKVEKEITCEACRGQLNWLAL
jgi:hypothetical protein